MSATDTIDHTAQETITNEPAKKHGRFARTMRRRLAAVALLLLPVAVAGLAAASPASAEVTSGRATMSCSGNQVRANVPASAYTRSNRANARIETLAELHRYNGSSWVSYASSGWYAYNTTNSAGYVSSTWYDKRTNFAWYNVNFTVPSGSYAVKTWFWDASDGRMTFVWNSASASSSAVYVCTL